jgi:sulfur-carrier protein
VTTLGALVDHLAGRDPHHEAALADRARLRGAVDAVFKGWDAPLAGAREIALFPPVTGG